MFNTPQLIAFDLDGTLVDSAPDITACIDKALRAMGLPVRGLAKVRNWMGSGVERLVKCALTDSMDSEPALSDYIKALDLFLSYYGKNTVEYSQLYPGVRLGLQWLVEQDFRLCCITNKRRILTFSLLQALNLQSFFGMVIAGDDLPQRKPHPLPLLHAARHFGVTPAMSLMVGDSVNDIEAARSAGFAVVAVSYGYNHGRDIREAKPDKVIDSLLELSTIPGIASTKET